MISGSAGREDIVSGDYDIYSYLVGIEEDRCLSILFGINIDKY